MMTRVCAHLLCGWIEIENLYGGSSGGYVKVLRFLSQKEISDAAADEIRLITRRAQTDDDRLSEFPCTHNSYCGSRVRVRKLRS